MEFSPLVTAGYAGPSSKSRYDTMALSGRAVWSETGTLPFVTTRVGPAICDSAGDPVFTALFPVDTYGASQAGAERHHGAALRFKGQRRAQHRCLS